MQINLPLFLLSHFLLCLFYYIYFRDYFKIYLDNTFEDDLLRFMEIEKKISSFPVHKKYIFKYLGLITMPFITIFFIIVNLLDL